MLNATDITKYERKDYICLQYHQLFFTQTFYELFANIKLYSLFKGIVLKFKMKVKERLISSYFSHGKLQVSSLLFV